MRRTCTALTALLVVLAGLIGSAANVGYLIVGFIGLGLSHFSESLGRGLVSLGVLTLVCIAANLFTTFVLLPALLQWREDVKIAKAAREALPPAQA